MRRTIETRLDEHKPCSHNSNNWPRTLSFLPLLFVRVAPAPLAFPRASASRGLDQQVRGSSSPTVHLDSPAPLAAHAAPLHSSPAHSSADRPRHEPHRASHPAPRPLCRPVQLACLPASPRVPPQRWAALPARFSSESSHPLARRPAPRRTHARTPPPWGARSAQWYAQHTTHRQMQAQSRRRAGAAAGQRREATAIPARCAV